VDYSHGVNQTPLLGTGGLIFMGLYLLSLIIIGWLGRKAQKENTLADFYLAGRGLGVFIRSLSHPLCNAIQRQHIGWVCGTGIP